MPPEYPAAFFCLREARRVREEKAGLLRGRRCAVMFFP